MFYRKEGFIEKVEFDSVRSWQQVLTVRAIRLANEATPAGALREHPSTCMALTLAVKFLFCNALTIVIMLIEALEDLHILQGLLLKIWFLKYFHFKLCLIQFHDWP
jgi:hypothetical protein